MGNFLLAAYFPVYSKKTDNNLFCKTDKYYHFLFICFLVATVIALETTLKVTFERYSEDLRFFFLLDEYKNYGKWDRNVHYVNNFSN